MSSELLLAAFLMAVGLVLAAAGTNLYQGVHKEPAELRIDGRTYFHAMGHTLMSFVCGPYIMLQLGWRQDSDGAVAMASVLLSSLVAFGWSFITGLLFVGAYVTVFH